MPAEFLERQVIVAAKNEKADGATQQDSDRERSPDQTAPLFFPVEVGFPR
jgi:hypothetical protein